MAVRDALERILGRYREGPRLPLRFVEVAERYWASSDERVPREWLAFAIGLASSAYRDGYVRGFESSERWERPWSSSPSPEDIADAEEPGWRTTAPHRFEE